MFRLTSREHGRDSRFTVVAAVGLHLRNGSVKVPRRTAIRWPARRPKPRTRSYYCCAASWFSTSLSGSLSLYLLSFSLSVFLSIYLLYLVVPLYVSLCVSLSLPLSYSLSPYALSPSYPSASLSVSRSAPLFLPLSPSHSLSLSHCRRASASEFSRLVLVLEGAEGELHRRRSRRPARWAVSGYCIGYGPQITAHGLEVTGRRLLVNVAGYGSPVTGHRLQVAGYGTTITGSRLRITCYGSPVTGHRLRVTGYGSPVTDNWLRVTDYELPVTGRRLRVTCCGLPVTVSPVTGYLLWVTGYGLPLTCYGREGGKFGIRRSHGCV